MGQYDTSTGHQADMRYIRTAMDAPMLERDHELDLARRWKEKKDEKALHELITSYTRLVVAVAAKFKNYGLPMNDLIQEGNIGLMEAAMRFEPALENRFSTYATWWIRAQIQDFILRNWSIVRTGTTSAQKSLFFNLRRLRAKIDGQSTRDHLDDDAVDSIAKELNVSQKDVVEMEARMSGDWSLNAPLGRDSEGHAEWMDMLADNKTPSPEDSFMEKQDGQTCKKWLLEALDTLNPRERIIIKQRRLAERGSTLDDLGKKLGVSKERVRQLENRAMDKLKTTLLAKSHAAGLDGYPCFH